MFNKTELRDAINNSTSIKEVLFLLLGRDSRSYSCLHRAVKREGLEVELAALRQRHRDKLAVGGFNEQKSTGDLLVKHGEPVTIGVIRKRLIKENLIPYVCQFCGTPPFWRDAEMVLDLDHIDGDRSNNQLDNLRFLCKNCHSQTPTYGSRNHIARSYVYSCAECGKRTRKKVAGKSGRCWECYKNKPRK